MADLLKQFKKKKIKHLFPITSMKGEKVVTIYVLAPRHRELLCQMEN